jgi:predicted DNA-binding transcriptional regulator YafY
VRSSRLLALLFELQQRGSATAPQLAEHLEVSVRTIYRDVAALQQAGVPLWTEAGPRGGIRLLEGWRTRLDGLTADEAGTLALAGAPSAASDLGLGSVLAAAQAKVRSTLPPELRARADRFAQRFHLDAPGWFHHDEDLTHLGTVAEAVWEGRRIDVGYQRGDRAVRRRLDPLGLVQKGGTWYLVAAHRGSSGRERGAGQPRTYRVSRITAVEARDDEVVRPDGFQLARWWADSSRDFDRSMLRSTVRLRLSPRAAGWVRLLVDQAAADEALAAAGPPDAEGWVEITLAVESDEVAAHQLLGLGGEVEVLEPPAVRQAMAAQGRAMLERHSPA